MHSSDWEDRRRQLRHDYVSTVKYCPQPMPGGSELDGYTLNISGAGVCLSVSHPLKEGQEVVITKCLLPVLLGRYKVKWIKQSEKRHTTTYLAGLTASVDKTDR